MRGCFQPGNLFWHPKADGLRVHSRRNACSTIFQGRWFHLHEAWAQLVSAFLALCLIWGGVAGVVSSGFLLLDDAARIALREWEVEAAKVNPVLVPSEVEVPVCFELKA